MGLDVYFYFVSVGFGFLCMLFASFPCGFGKADLCLLVPCGELFWWMWNMCICLCPEVWEKAFFLCSHVSYYSFIHIVCPIELPLFIMNIAKYLGFSSWFHHRIKSYGAFNVNRAVFFYPHRYNTSSEEEKGSESLARNKRDWIECAHILFTFQWLCVIAHDTQRDMLIYSFLSVSLLVSLSSDKDHFDTARKYLKITGFEIATWQLDQSVS